MSILKTLEKVGLPILGAIGGDFLGPEIGLSPELGGAIGGALGGLGGGLLSGGSMSSDIMGALLGGVGGYGLGAVLGPDAGFGAGGAFGGPAVGAGGAPAGTSAISGSTTGAGADAIASATGGSTEGSGIMDFLKRNPWLMPAGAAGIAMLEGNQPIPGEKQLKALAAQTGDVSKMMNALQTGQLPPGAKALIDNATNDAIAGIRSNYANMGLSGSSMEAQDIAAAQQRAAAQTFQLASAVTTQGLDAAGLQAKLYEIIAQMTLGQDQDLTNALAGLSGAGGYSGGLKSVAG